MGDDGHETETAEGWPVSLRGVTESVVTTLGPNELWNAAALGLHAPDDADAPVTATTWGRTRTRRNFERRGSGVVQFVTDPREFVDAALTIREEEGPILPSADAWVEVEVERLDAGVEGGASDDGTEWVEWALHPVESAVLAERPLTINRGFYAVVDATVAASRLDVPAYDTDELLDRLAYFAETVGKCGGPEEREAFETLGEVTGWRERRESRG
ncbi:DUF447 domain-containing protein [Halobium salinum]|uniref:DUF447 domain-containing protein n=1 Tax=Halobium salinum TaxID=1364940 RepID=A0ABD5P8C1_9EURY|nr:DUF447 domain-containing protein [Halobium salinum]